MNIILLGFKNCGKTTLGKLLAEKLELPFVDIDRLLEKSYQEKHGKILPVRQIYETLGETKFRDLEKKVINSLTQTKNTIIATGGGSVTKPENVKILKNIGKFIYLKASKNIIKERMFAGSLPPFLDAKDKEGSFEKMYTTRETIYNTIADIIIEITAKTNEKIIQEIKKVTKDG